MIGRWRILVETAPLLAGTVFFPQLRRGRSGELSRKGQGQDSRQKGRRKGGKGASDRGHDVLIPRERAVGLYAQLARYGGRGFLYGLAV